CQYNNWISF
nr:immunoglobulin light chain junction region [Macaca mulatta]